MPPNPIEIEEVDPAVRQTTLIQQAIDFGPESSLFGRAWRTVMPYPAGTTSRRPRRPGVGWAEPVTEQAEEAFHHPMVMPVGRHKHGGVATAREIPAVNEGVAAYPFVWQRKVKISLTV